MLFFLAPGTPVVVITSIIQTTPSAATMTLQVNRPVVLGSQLDSVMPFAVSVAVPGQECNEGAITPAVVFSTGYSTASVFTVQITGILSGVPGVNHNCQPQVCDSLSQSILCPYVLSF